MYSSRSGLDDHVKMAFLILSVLFVWMCILYCFVAGYHRTKKQEQDEQERNAAAAAEQATRLREHRRRRHLRGEASDHDDVEKDPLRLDRVLKALTFETLRLPPRRPSLAKDGDKQQDVESGMCDAATKAQDKDDVTMTSSSSSSDDDDPSNMERLSSSSSSLDTSATSILARLALPWWRAPNQQEAEQEEEDNGDCCCICLDPYQANDIICSPTCSDCNHIFHERCAIQWFQKHDECPMCRTNIMIVQSTNNKASSSTFV